MYALSAFIPEGPLVVIAFVVSTSLNAFKNESSDVIVSVKKASTTSDCLTANIGLLVCLSIVRYLP